MALLSVLLGILQRPTILDVLRELIMFMAPVWIAVILGVLVGWAWKPKWANLGRDLLNCSVSKGAAFSVPPINSVCSSSQIEQDKSTLLTEHDLEHLCKLVEVKDGGPAWIPMMDRSTPTMSYQAWRRDPETGPRQYRSRTVFEDATLELVRDFFWDDAFRLKWDDMLIHASTMEECTATGTMIVHWVRKFPFFCSDREYVIGRRIWESGRSYYCVTKGVPSSSVPRHNKPKRVDLYYSSWCIRKVESRRQAGHLTACEVLLFHYEGMGISWEIAKLGVRQGMWGAVKKIEPGLRDYQKERASGGPLSQCACMARINTKVSTGYLSSLESTICDSLEIENQDISEKSIGKNIPRLLVVGGAFVLACTLDKGLLTKAVIFGVARRFLKIGKRL
ncbi:StAR-related lipid transfer protein like [Quillaja saponaria]|uniref:StAR-related lipid transfer protein like n=1 Tax=Quillaja saponaria TaxID=32244 RepID=A0AAD7L5Z1_QUISA|nr:StAR-related lipid transfer protein like [Quillaja saponaria]